MTTATVTTAFFLLLLLVAPVAAGLGVLAKCRGDRSALVLAWITSTGAVITAAIFHFWLAG